jgi:hypothetical protein
LILKIKIDGLYPEVAGGEEWEYGGTGIRIPARFLIRVV